MNEHLHTLEEIREWAKSKHPNEVVGISRRLESCPLSHCHNELDGKAEGYYGFSLERVAIGDGRVVTPSYIRQIIWRVDDTGIYFEPVTATRFLAILDEVEYVRLWMRLTAE